MTTPNISVLYHLFSSDEGEVMSGGGLHKTEDFPQYIAELLHLHLRDLLVKSGDRTISLVIEIDEV